MNELIDTFANRLSYALTIRNMKPIELAEKTKIDKSKISSYMSGRYKAKTDGLKIIADVLNVSPIWLMGYDVPMEKEITTNNSDNNNFRYANHNGINTDGLDENDIEEINRFVEFIKNKKKNENK